MSKKNRIVLGVTASIAAYKAADLVRRLNDQGFEVTVVMTREAQLFISTLTLSSLSGKKVYTDMFLENSDDMMPHIRLAKETDLLLIAPATAHTIGKIANGLADDLLSMITMVTTSPIVIVPAMNDQMYHNKIFQMNVTKLKEIGVKFIDPIKGSLACGVFAEGHFPEVETIVNQVKTMIS